jgi:MarR family 2-MHQ and catechol resistance regulon transcriptional repressor
LQQDEVVYLTNERISPETEQARLSLELFVVLSRAYKAVMEHAVHDIRRYQLNPTEFAVLELLYHKGPQPLQQIGAKILLASGSITYVIDKLEQKGYINRTPCPKDRRITYASISDKGTKWLDRIFPEHKKAIALAVDGLDSDEMKTAIQLLKKLGIEAQNQSK